MEYREGYMPDLDVTSTDNQAVLAGTVERFNRGDECWCLLPWRDLCFHDCWVCLLCCNHTSYKRGLDEEHKCALFAQFAAGLGFAITRPGYEKYTCRNLAGNTAVKMEQ